LLGWQYATARFGAESRLGREGDFQNSGLGTPSGVVLVTGAGAGVSVRLGERCAPCQWGGSACPENVTAKSAIGIIFPGGGRRRSYSPHFLSCPGLGLENKPAIAFEALRQSEPVCECLVRIGALHDVGAGPVFALEELRRLFTVTEEIQRRPDADGWDSWNFAVLPPAASADAGRAKTGAPAASENWPRANYHCKLALRRRRLPDSTRGANHCRTFAPAAYWPRAADPNGPWDGSLILSGGQGPAQGWRNRPAQVRARRGPDSGIPSH